METKSMVALTTLLWNLGLAVFRLLTDMMMMNWYINYPETMFYTVSLIYGLFLKPRVNVATLKNIVV